MLEKDLYIITEQIKSDTGALIKLMLVPEHIIFKGHFPGQPVLPGACMLQIVKELTEITINKKLLLQKADSLKFLTFVDPERNNRIYAELSISKTGEQCGVIGRLSTEEATFFKFSGTFIEKVH